MMIWFILLAMTAAAVMAVLWPLSRHYAVARQSDPNTRFYKEQIAEIDRDRDRGAMPAAEAESAKAEAARRLLRANDAADAEVVAVGEPALRRRRAASTLALSVVPILALAVYGATGSPHILEDAPKPAAAAGADLGTAVGQIEAHLAKNPQDGRGWEVIAPVYLRMGRLEDAVKAYEAALRTLGPEGDRLANYGEALVIAKDGLVSKDAQTAFEKSLALDPGSAKSRLYLARAAEQDGRLDKARQDYDAILAASPPDAPWASLVRDQLARLDGAKVAAASDSADAIAGMVSSLSSRLESQGGSADEWARLMRSYSVMGQRDKAAAATLKARQALAGDPAGLQTIDTMARELRLSDVTP
ncbi:c-type cytochrome biogenesis protein CcmI [Microvirga antarctica]|uniref:c-type cytochrome biogenesis protein CcmI n=1 Tax=Microvirga antarctica TaxID=2819233 RepID=UPI001B306DF0|nr:c-type cytochrome biogenesis protein CcmI [Microvirga antarctica]